MARIAPMVDSMIAPCPSPSATSWTSTPWAPSRQAAPVPGDFRKRLTLMVMPIIASKIASVIGRNIPLPALLLAALAGTPAFAQSPDEPVATPPMVDSDRAQQTIDDALFDKNPDSRRHAVQALGLIGPREPWAGQLRRSLKDRDVEVRVAAIASLVDLRDKDTVPALVEALDDEVPEVSFAAAKALWSLEEPSGRNALMAVLSGDVKASSGFFTSKKREALRMFQTPRTMFMFVLKQGVGMVGVSGLGTGVSSLEGVLSANGTSGRAATALMLSSDPDPMVKAALLDALHDEDWPVRAAAAHAIALRNDPALKEQLLPLFDDKHLAVRVRAAAAWLRLDMVKVEPPPPPKPTRRKPRKRREG